MPTQTIVVPVYNRQLELLACLDCLKAAPGLDQWHVKVGDDASTEFDITELMANIMPDCDIVRRQKNVGGDRNSVELVRAALNDGSKRIFLLDSDMIVSPDVFEFIDDVFERTDGILSVYNSLLHAEHASVDDDIVTKSSIGAAATVWDADVLKELLDQLARPDAFDWQLCALAQERGLRLCVARRSRAQHIGIRGVRAKYFGELEYGKNFEIKTETQARALANCYEELMLAQHKFARSKGLQVQKIWRYVRVWEHFRR